MKRAIPPQGARRASSLPPRGWTRREVGEIRLLAAFPTTIPAFSETPTAQQKSTCSRAEEWSLQPAAFLSIACSCPQGWISWISSCSGDRALPARQSQQQGNQELPAHHSLLSLSVWLQLSGVCGASCLHPPLIQMVSEKRRPGGGQRGSLCLA